jgi:peptide/nickel transport system substrate-binding protein
LQFRGGAEFRRIIDWIEVVDDRHLAFYFKEVSPAFFAYSVRWPGIVPKAYVEKVGNEEFAKHPIGAGPFRWMNYQQDVFVKAEAVADHYRKVPSVKTVNFKFAMEPAALMANFKSGKADIVQIPIPSYSQVRDDRKTKVVWSKFCYSRNLVFCDLAFPSDPSPFHDIRVRQALSFAINRREICDKVLHGCAEPYWEILAPYQPGFDPYVKPDPYNPRRAKALLNEAGYPNGFETVFHSGYFGDQVEVRAIAADLAKVGIRAKIDEVEMGAFASDFREKTFRGLVLYPAPFWNGEMHPAQSLQSMISEESPVAYVTTPEADTRWNKLAKLIDEKAIAAEAKELSRIWRKAQIRSCLWTYHQPLGLSPRIRYYRPIPAWMGIGGLEFLELKEE